MKMVLTDQEHSDRGAILKGLRGYNESKVGPSRWKALTLVLLDTKRRVVAGLQGHTHFDWLLIALLWVDDRYRGRGSERASSVGPNAKRFGEDAVTPGSTPSTFRPLTSTRS